jgi:exodeoxyribonuclease VII small subunit
MPTKRKKPSPAAASSKGGGQGVEGAGAEPPGDAEASLSFEAAIEEVEEIVREMENDEIPLESLLRRYERGTRLVQVCQRRIDEAQARIEMIASGQGGGRAVVRFDGRAGEGAEGGGPGVGGGEKNGGARPGAGAKPEGRDDDVRLL